MTDWIQKDKEFKAKLVSKKVLLANGFKPTGIKGEDGSKFYRYNNYGLEIEVWDEGACLSDLIKHTFEVGQFDGIMKGIERVESNFKKMIRETEEKITKADKKEE